MKRDLIVIGGLVLGLVGLLLFQAYLGKVVRQRFEAQGIAVQIDNLNIKAEVADTNEKRHKGLGGRDSLPQEAGMLFVFEEENFHPFWMKDTKIPLDIIWISSAKEVIDLTPNVAPQPNVSDFELKVYRPRVKARYALEIGAGMAAKNGVSVGDRANFEIPEKTAYWSVF